MKKYTAQICNNGHVITESIEDLPGSARNFCKECGESTIVVCQICNGPIEGRYSGPDAWMAGPMPPYYPPNYCDNCGVQFPWTEKRIETVKDFIADIEDLSDEEKAELTNEVDEIVKETTRTEASANKFKSLLAKAGKGVAEKAENILIQVASETAAKIFLGK